MCESWGGLCVSHLFFTDDVLLFAEATQEHAVCIKEGPDLFSKASGERVNYNNSLLFVSPNVDTHATVELSTKVGIPTTFELGRYLGIISYTKVGKTANKPWCWRR